MLPTLFEDLRYGTRVLGKRPLYAVVAILTIAIGVGATTAVFSVIRPVLLDGLPYPRAARLVSVTDLAADYSPIDVTFGSFRELQARSRSFEALTVMKAWQPTIVGAGRPERLEGERVSGEYFHVLGVEPVLGRALNAADDRLGAPAVAVISDGLWRRRFGADPAIVGRTTTLDDVSTTVIGVMPRGFEQVTAPSVEVWAPLQYDTSLPIDGREWGHHLAMIGRLRDGVPIDAARDDVRTIAAGPQTAFPRPPWAALRNGLRVESLRDTVAHDVKPVLLAVLGAVLLLLAVAVVNVTSLQLARGEERRGEFAVRAALGAAPGRVVQQLAAESLVLAAAGGALGTAIAIAGVRELLAVAPADLPHPERIHVDAIAFVVAFGTAAAVGLLTGIVPALGASRRALVSGLQQASARTARRRATGRRALVVVEIALALTVLVGAGLLLHSVARLLAVDPGFSPAGTVTMQVQAASGRFNRAGETRRFFDTALEAVRRVPGVASAALSSQVPLTGSRDVYGARLQATPGGEADADGGASRYACTPDWFQTMGVTITRGRPFDDHDDEQAPGVAVISESLARSRLHGRDPIGQWIRLGPVSAPWRQVVGVARNIHQTSLAIDDADAVYVPVAQSGQFSDRALWLVARTRGDAAALAPALETAVWSVDADQPIVRISTMDAFVTASIGKRRFALLLFEVFALVALVLAAVGVYGVLSTTVAEQTREIGVRAALGASRRRILGLVAGQAARLTASGVALGLIGAVGGSRVLTTLLFGVSTLDPITYAAVVGVLVVVSALACLLPAWRAVTIDPAVALRAE